MTKTTRALQVIGSMQLLALSRAAVTTEVIVVSGSSESGCNIGSNKPVWGAKVEDEEEFHFFHGDDNDCPAFSPGDGGQETLFVYTYPTDTDCDEFGDIEYEVCLIVGDNKESLDNCFDEGNTITADALSCDEDKCFKFKLPPCDEDTGSCEVTQNEPLDVIEGRRNTKTRDVVVSFARHGNCLSDETNSPTQSPSSLETNAPTLRTSNPTTANTSPPTVISEPPTSITPPPTTFAPPPTPIATRPPSSPTQFPTITSGIGANSEQTSQQSGFSSKSTVAKLGILAPVLILVLSFLAYKIGKKSYDPLTKNGLISAKSELNFRTRRISSWRGQPPPDNFDGASLIGKLRQSLRRTQKMSDLEPFPFYIATNVPDRTGSVTF